MGEESGSSAGAGQEVVGNRGERGGGLEVLLRIERGRERLPEEGDGSDLWVPHGRERRGKEGWLPAGPWPKKRKGAWDRALQAERKRERGEKEFHFSFSKTIIQTHFSNEI